VRLAITQRARQQIENIHAYIARDNPEAADRLVAAIIAKLEFIEEFPETGVKLRRRNDPDYRFRFAVVTPYSNYLVIYQLRRTMIRVVRVMEGHADLTRYFAR
jgi:toxin ParE1/3/4